MGSTTNAARGALVLLILAGLGAGFLKALEGWTAERVARNDERARTERLDRLLAGRGYDNVPARESIKLDGVLEGVEFHRAYRVRRGSTAVGLVVEVTATDGYSGPIRLLVGIDEEGAIIASAVLAHRETPGLGDRIEPRHSTWLASLEQRRLGAQPERQWRPRRAGGAFDALAGATVTSRAVLHAVAGALTFHARFQGEIWRLPIHASMRVGAPDPDRYPRQ